MTATRRATTLIGLAIAVVLPAIGPTRFLPPVAGVDPLYVREWFWWALLAVVLLYVLLVERRSLASIGLKRPGWRTVAFGALASGVAAGGMVAVFTFVFPALHLHANAEQMQKIVQTPFWYRFFLVTRAAVMEETLFRGYGIERLGELLGNRWVAGAATCVMFTFAHLSGWGWAQLLIAGWGGIVLTLLYLWRRDLVCNMIGHWITDAVGVLLPH